MIELDDLRRVSEAQGVRVDDLSTDETDYREFRDRLHAYLLSEGFNPDAVRAWAIEQALEDLGLMFGGMSISRSLYNIIGARLSVAYSIGLEVGWRMHREMRDREEGS